MPDFRLRKARAPDAPRIRALIRAVRINPLGLDWQRFVIAESLDGEFLGCGQIKPHGDGVDELASIAVWPEHRRNGVARAIVEYLLSEHPAKLYLMCAEPTCPMYEKFGFRALSRGEMPPYFARMTQLASLMNGMMPGGPRVLAMERDGA